MKKENKPMDLPENMIELIDDTGKHEFFKLIDIVRYEDADYAVMQPTEPPSEKKEKPPAAQESNDSDTTMGLEEIAVVILKIEQDGEDMSLIVIEDEDELECVFSAFAEKE